MYSKDPKRPSMSPASAKQTIETAQRAMWQNANYDSYLELSEIARSALRSALGLNPEPSGLVFTCQIGSLLPGTLQVTEFSLTEALSSLFSLSINAVSLEPSLDFQAHLGQVASLTVKRDGQVERVITGILAEAVQGNSDCVKTWYHFVIRPEMWIMTLKQDSRIFQDTTVPKILETLLNESHVKHDKLLYHPEEHLERPYTTQKRETMYDFWCRLAAEEGITFWFEESPQMFYSDRRLGMKAGIDITYNPQSDTDVTDSTATTWQYAERLCSDIRVDKDYNQLRPSHPLNHQTIGDVHQQHEVFESYGRFQEDAQGEPLNKIRYEQSQTHRRTGTANTNCIQLAPGRIFRLANHPDSKMNDSWQVVSAHHRGVQPLADNSGGEGTHLSNTVNFMPSSQEWRPPYRYKPTADGNELATVVGPPGEEIYTNSQGAVTVYFHWDRRGKADHSASCRVRVAQGWNGNGFGFMAIPRVGQEVIISYLNNDIDKPIITGCTYNGRNTPPLNLPEEKTRTTFKTKTHKGEGFNELRFEDYNGKQEIYLHAQKDMNTYVLNDRTTEVNHDHSEWIKHDQSIKIDHNLTEEIGHQRSTVIWDNDTLVTKGYRHRETEKNESLNVKGQQALTVGKSQFIDITGDQKVMVGRHIELRTKNGEIVIANAGGHIIIDPQGNIKIEGASVSINQLGGKGVLSDAIYDYSAGFVLNDEVSGQPLKNTLYKIISSDGQEVIGKTDAAGRTVIVQTQSTEPLTLQLAETPPLKKEHYFRVADNTKQEYIMEFKEER